MGAEAILYRDGDRVIKKRIRKKYRHPILDERIRRFRTRREAKLLKRARELGVPAPRVIEVIDDDTLVMEYIEGRTLKDVLKEEKRIDLMEALGRLVATLHQNDVVHGDLTTSNVILSGETLYLIDFGLGEVTKRIEDKAVDLVCFEKSYTATHSDFPEGWEAFLRSYADHYPEGERVLKRMEEVKRRARYL